MSLQDIETLVSEINYKSISSGFKSESMVQEIVNEELKNLN